MSIEQASGMDIAVVGLAGRFPGANDPVEFWRNLRGGVESVVRYTDKELLDAGVDRATLRNRSYVKWGAPLRDMEQFDAGFFGFSPRDAAIMDPQHRHFLEVAWEALERAGHPPEAFEGQIGVFAGSGMHAYLAYNLLSNPALINSVGMFLIRHTGNDKDFLTTRLSYLLNLRGPSINIQTACSTSLVAIHVASQSLLSGECDMALAGGVTIEVPHRRGYVYQEGEILSPDGHCRSFDASSKGTVFGSGAGVVALRRLEDALADGDHIHAVIRGSAVNNDGSQKVGYLAPSVDGQAKAVAEALAISGVPAETIGYIEAHGTGTPVGDPIELAALTQAFRGAGATDKTFCGIGSAKSNIGHLDTAAGVAGFMKAVLALEHKQMPPSLHFEQPNPAVDFASTPFFVNAELRDWQSRPGGPRRAAVNSLGVGGTNAFVILEEAPSRAPSPASSRPYQLLTLSARSGAALDQASARLAQHLQDNPDANLADVAYTLQVGRRAFGHRRVLAARDSGEAIGLLQERNPKRVFDAAVPAIDSDRSVVFVFPGGGAQHPDACRELYDDEPVYRTEVDRCLRLLAPHYTGPDLKALMFPAADAREHAARELERPSVGLPALFITEYALARLWMSWGVQPAAMTGHSLGEYAAACLAGVMSLEDALRLVLVRGELFETLPDGAMLSVRLPENELQPLLAESGLSIAAINAPGLCLVSGDVAAIATFEQRLAERDVEYSRLKINVAAHSAMLEPILAEFGKRVASFTLRPPTLPYVSNLTGTWVTAAEATSPDYYVRHLRHAVRFADGMAELLKDPHRIYLEVGPGQTLTSLVKAQVTPGSGPLPAAIPSARHPKDAASDVQSITTALGRLWAAGARIDWPTLHGDELTDRRRVPLPTYAFEHQRYWIEPGQPLPTADYSPQLSLEKMPDVEDWFYQPVWEQVPAPAAASSADSPLRWLVFADALGLGELMARRLEQAGHAVSVVTSGTRFERAADTRYTLAPGNREDYDALVAAYQADHGGALPQRIVHLWSLLGLESALLAGHSDAIQERGFYSLLFLAQALGSEDIAAGLHIGVISDNLQPVNGSIVRLPERATVFGPCKVIPRELERVTCQSIDVELSTSPSDIEALADQLIGELRAAPSNTDALALHQGQRWVERFEPTPLARAEESSTSALRDGGVYLITGGMGGIGLVQAEHIARTVRDAKLVLVGRTGLPPRESWGSGLDAEVAARVRHVQALEAHGASVLVLGADVADRAQVEAVIRQARTAFAGAPINGVIHGAGTLHDGVLQLKTRETASSVLSPKVGGALALDAALTAAQPEALDFFVVFSSTSAILSPAGQVDYVGANAFLNAFAHSKSAEATSNGSQTRYVAVDWGVWAEVGMAARAAGVLPTQTAAALPPPDGEPAEHAMLGIRAVDELDKAEYRVQYATSDHWFVDQHRIKDGPAVLPGTGYIELARAALATHEGTGDADAIEIRDLVFLSPLQVPDGVSTDVRIALSAAEDEAEPQYTLSVASLDTRAELVEHATATVAVVDASSPAAYDLAAIRARCNVRETVYEPGQQHTKQEDIVVFGPRWKVLRRIDFGSGEALATLELAEEFGADLTEFKAHPALLDLATGFPLPLIEGYDDPSNTDFYAPLSYRRILIRGPLPARVFGYARQRSHTGDIVVFDIDILDEHGNPLVEVESFTMKRVSARALSGTRPPAPATQHDRPRGLLDLGTTEGIRPAEGADALARILSANGAVGAQVVATSIDLYALLQELGGDNATAPSTVNGEGGAGGLAISRPELSSSFAAPTTEYEARLATLWQELMGLERVGIHDDFFELGGHSLLAVRLFTRIKKSMGVDLSLETLFQAPTIALCAQLIADELGVNPPLAAAQVVEVSAPNVESEPTTVPVPTMQHDAPSPLKPAKRSWSSLVPIQTKGSGTPFFCIHGAGGNVLNFNDLARRLDDGRPFYALQAQGVDGRLPPHERIEDMAAHYLAAIRTVQPNGPYLLGGYSGGGVIAFEMAQQLRRVGETTAMVALLDTFSPLVEERRYTLRERIQNVLSGGPGYLVGKFAAAREERNVRRQVRLAKEHLARGEVVPLELREVQMTVAYLETQGRYQPEPYGGRLTLFRASQVAPISAHAGPFLGWDGLAEGGIEVHEIESGHHNLVLEPNVGQLAAALKSCLARAETPFDANTRRLAPVIAGSR